jgi:hypothetical protein
MRRRRGRFQANHAAPHRHSPPPPMIVSGSHFSCDGSGGQAGEWRDALQRHRIIRHSVAPLVLRDDGLQDRVTGGHLPHHAEAPLPPAERAKAYATIGGRSAPHRTNMMAALDRDVVSNTGGEPKPGTVHLREGKRPRPIVLRVNVGSCIEIHWDRFKKSGGPHRRGASSDSHSSVGHCYSLEFQPE